MIPSRKIIPILLACLIAVSGIIYAKQASQKSVANHKADGGLVVAPEANISTSTVSQLLSFEEESEFSDEPLSETVTANLSRDLFASFILARDQGLALNPNNIEALVQSATTQSKSAITGKDVYRVTDFKVQTNAGINELKIYSENLLQAFNLGHRLPAEDELEILNRAVTNNNPAELEQLDQFVSDYRAVVNRLLLIPVPQVAVLVHFDLVNSLNNLATDTEQMKKIFTDPAVGLVGVNAYAQDSDYLLSAAQNANRLFLKYNISFDL